ncbi:histidinol-phosphate transaminase [Deinococcus sp. Leaf326]|uniref:aminotransferase class I/II-fold pyridoxal phosphate-dependent enzyme n=1 Tax=Deinococcus sp. Leaf326 TaxID=1736338 RepID=UPI0006F9CFA8|nr:histidinol-phosphate transaminase [Deinococcus sp. Leaf326]KQR22764.1 histidinol phosphate aminotransferase [Deinococcus sp. Leaf326]
MANLPPLMPRAPHGGPSSAAFTGLDFSVNANPYGPNPALLRAVREADHAHYPDPAYRAVRERLASWHGRTPDGVALSVGASDLLHRLVRAFVPPGGLLLSLNAPFGELARAAALGYSQVEVVSELPDLLPPGTALVYVGAPHNPTGRAPTPAEVQHLADVCEEAGALLIVDEAYAPFVLLDPPPVSPAVVRLLSPGKAHGLVGARPAYALGTPEVAARLDNLAPAWHLPAGTAALLAALPDAGDFLAATLPRVRADAGALARHLTVFGPVEHHGAPFMTLEVGDGAGTAVALLAHGVRVRDCASYGLPGHIRVSTRGAVQDSALLTALGQWREAHG